MTKLGTAIGSGTPDPAQAPAAAAPIPPISIEDKPAPGRRGPKGLSPRTSYSRVNTGAPPVPDARGAAQKAAPPRGLEFLPRKTAQDHHMPVQERPTIQDMLKAAMQGTLSKVDLVNEANIQAGNQGRETEEEVKTAQPEGHIPTAQLLKLASTLDYAAAKIAEEGTSKNTPGNGPGALEVSESRREEKNIDAGEMGSAMAKHIPPKTPALQPEVAQSGKANTGLETNDDMSHPEQPKDPWGNEKAKLSSAAKRVAKIASAQAPPKSVSAPVGLIRQFFKQAEDAINPAQITTGKDTPPDASASEEGVPAQPSDVNNQQRMVSSNQAAINYTKREAKADPKADLNKVLTEPAQTKTTDKTLDKVLDHTNQAGAKISSVVSPDDKVKIASVRALLSKLAADCEADKKKEKKEKQSQINPDPAASLPTGPASSMAPTV